jgi:ketosteroid isomerase-like protein
MRKQFSTLFAAVSLVALAQCVVVADAAADKKTIESAYQKATAGLNKKDVSPIIGMYTPDAVSIGEKGQKRSVKDSLPQLKQMASVATSINATAKVTSVKVSGATAVAKVDQTITIVLPGQGGAAQTIKASELGEDSWVKTAQGWKIKQSKTIKSTSTLNGQPLPKPGG